MLPCNTWKQTEIGKMFLNGITPEICFCDTLIVYSSIYGS